MRACFFVLLAILFMIFDFRSSSFHHFRQNLSVVVYPFQVLVNAPIQWTHRVAASITSEQRLIEENARLRAHDLLLQSRLQKLLALEHENRQLKEILQSTSHVSGNVKVAKLMAVDLDPNVQEIVVNKGSKEKIYVGQPVLDAYGVMGQVVDVDPETSKILLLTDPRSAISVKDQRSGYRSIAVGTGTSHRLVLLYVNDMSQISVGDLFVTSGLGLHYPVGYPVGIVTSIKKVLGKRFVQVTLAPSAHFDRTQQVILVWPDKANLDDAVRKELDKDV